MKRVTSSLILVMPAVCFDRGYLMLAVMHSVLISQSEWLLQASQWLQLRQALQESQSNQMPNPSTPALVCGPSSLPEGRTLCRSLRTFLCAQLSVVICSMRCFAVCGQMHTYDACEQDVCATFNSMTYVYPDLTASCCAGSALHRLWKAQTQSLCPHLAR